MSDVQYQQPQFRTQDVFRTISVAFQPYIPFTQAYRMKLMGGEAMLANKMVSGRGTSGYFHWAPQEEPSAVGTREKLGNYPWFVRRMSYGGEGMGRLAGMSVNPIREQKILEKVDGIQGEGSAQMMGEELRALLDTGKAFEVDVSTTWEPGLSRDPFELEAKAVVDLFGNEMNATGISFQDQSFMDIGRDPDMDTGVRQDLAPGYLGGFDIDLSKLSEDAGFKDFLMDSRDEGGLGLRNAMAVNASNFSNLDNTHSLEISQAVARVNRPSKLLTGINPNKFSSPENLLQGWIVHIKDQIAQWNALLKEQWDNLMQEQGGWNPSYNTSGQLNRSRELWHAFASVRKKIETPGAYGARMGYGPDAQLTQGEWMEKKTQAALREMTHRLMIDAYAAFLNDDIDETSHLWSAPLGDNIGLTMFWPEFKKQVEPDVGFAADRGFGRTRETLWPVPQIGWDPSIVTILPVDKGNIILAYTMWLQGKGHIDEIRREALYTQAKQNAHDVSVSNEARLLLAQEGAMMKMPMEKTGIAVKWIETRMIQPTALAQALHDQIMDYYSSGLRKQQAKDWYTNLMEESNKLTHQWFDAQEMGEGPTVGTPNNMGTTRSSEYVIGDELGNPRKHYLGVWSDRMKDT